MKFLGNQWVVALLAVVAMIIVAVQTFHFHRRPAAAPVALPPAIPAHMDSPSNGLAPAPVPLPVANIDSDYARAHLAAWISEPQRDPFWQTNVVVIATPGQMKPLSQLKLKAVWRQDGVSVAAINHGSYRPGDVVEGYLVKNIEDNGVWLENRGQKTWLMFDSQVMSTSPNRGMGTRLLRDSIKRMRVLPAAPPN